MKKYFLFIVLLPLLGVSQVKSKKTTAKETADKTIKAAAADSYLINGNITGYPDGTTVDLLNGQNGQPELSTSILNGKFSFAGKLQYPDFKLISFNKAGPYITLFLDNSTVNITANKDALDKAVVKGSPTNDDFIAFNALVKPYEKLFSQEGNTDSASIKQAASQLEGFARKYKSSYVAPLAIYRTNLLTANTDLMEELYNNLVPVVRTSPIGNYIAQLIVEAKRNPIGKPLADFSQLDTSGNLISLSSLRGKYVLVDFWASWCGPCRLENPNVLNVFNKFKNKNFTVLGVSLDKSKEPWIKAINDDGLTWAHISDLKGWGNAVAVQFQIQQIPQNFLVDPSGIVIAKNLRGAALDSKLASLLK